MNLLGVDYGTNYIGLALYTDSIDTIMPLKTVKSNKDVAYKVLELAKKYRASTVVIGKTEAKGFEDFVSQLKRGGLRVVVVSEDYTTAAVVDQKRTQEAATARQIKRLKSGGIIDTLSAVKILEKALDEGII